MAILFGGYSLKTEMISSDIKDAFVRRSMMNPFCLAYMYILVKSLFVRISPPVKFKNKHPVSYILSIIKRYESKSKWGEYLSVQ